MLLQPLRIRRPEHRSAGMLLMALAFATSVLSQGPLSAQDTGLPNVTTESELTPEQAKTAMDNLRRQLDDARRQLAALREQSKPGVFDPAMAQAENELLRNQNALQLYEKMIPNLVGPRDEKKSAEIAAIKIQLAAIHKHAAGDPARQQALAQEQLAMIKQALAAREMALAEARQELAQRDREQNWPPFEGELKVYSLLKLPAKDAAKSIESLFGPRMARIAIDDRTNALLVYGKKETLPAIDSLLMKLDQNDEAVPKREKNAATTPLLLRILWLADGVAGSDTTLAETALPANVINATKKLGLVDPVIAAQSVTALAVRGEDNTGFSATVPASLANHRLQLGCSGALRLANGDHVALEVQVAVRGDDVNSELQGSLAMPLGHYMVLGTSNAVLPESDAADRMSRFAFIVQVIRAESYAPEEQE